MFFGAAIHNYGVRELLDAFATLAPPPQPRGTETRTVAPDEAAFSGFVFKIQANMDPAHRDRIAFLRVCSGAYQPGMRMYHTRLAREVRVGDAITFMAADRQHVEEAYAGDIIGLHNHGTINIGDSFTQGEPLVFTGIPSFAPELFRRAVLRDPLKLKALQKGLAQLCEEGATQLFRPSLGNDLILGAVGPLQFEVAAYRLRDEYGVEAVFESVGVVAARWVRCDDERTRRVHEEARRQRRARPCRPARLPGAEHREPVADAGALAEDSVLHDARVERRGVRSSARAAAKRRDLGLRARASAAPSASGS